MSDKKRDRWAYERGWRAGYHGLIKIPVRPGEVDRQDYGEPDFEDGYARGKAFREARKARFSTPRSRESTGVGLMVRR